MHKRIIGMLTGVAFAAALTYTAYIGLSVARYAVRDRLYATTTTVIAVNGDDVICEDFNGNLWEFSGSEDWQVGDIASLLMNNRGTEAISDDEILSARYNGFVK